MSPRTARPPASGSAEHEVGKFLRANGYRYYHVSGWYEPTYDNPIADEVLRHGKTPEFDAVLRDATALPAIERIGRRRATGRPIPPPPSRGGALRLSAAARAWRTSPAGSSSFAHVLMPHPPYVFDEDGNHVPKATVLEKGEDGVFEPQLRYTNTRILEIVDELLDRPDGGAAHHRHHAATRGRSSAGDVDCIDRTPETYGIRFGTLRAYYLPGLDYTVPPDDTSVNIFRMLFREYFGADLPDLPNRSYDWPDNDHIYDFRDITDELPLPGG